MSQPALSVGMGTASPVTSQVVGGKRAHKNDKNCSGLPKLAKVIEDNPQTTTLNRACGHDWMWVACTCVIQRAT